MNKNIKAVSALALGTAISVNSIAPSTATATETKTTNNVNTIKSNNIVALNTIKVVTSVDKTIQSKNTNNQNATEVSIPDKKLEALIRTALSKNSNDTITKDDMAKLKTLNIQNKGVEDLTGLETATNLESLDISYNAIANFAPISKLPNLRILMAESTTLKDLSTIEGLTGLKYLFVGMNPIQDTTTLSKFTDLEGVDFTSTRLTSVPDISKLPKLKHLLLDSTKVTDISGIKGSEIVELGLSYLDIKDYSPLKNSKVQALYVDEAKNFDISIVKNMDFLTSISLDGICKSNLQKTIDILKTKEHLHQLSLSDNGITDISKILTLPQLNKTSTGAKFKLILDGNFISDFSGLKNKSNVIVSGQDQTIKLSSSKIKSDTLEIKPALKSFDGNSIRTFTIEKDGLVSPDSVSVEGNQDSLIIKGLKPGVHELRINYKAGNLSETTSAISGTMTQRVTVSNGLDLIVTQEKNGVNNNGVFVFVKPADKDNNIGSITTSQGDTLPATGGVIEVTENKDLIITAIDKNDSNKKLEYTESIVSIDKSGPTIDLAAAKNSEGKTEVTITAKNEAKGLSKVIFPSEKEVEFKGDIFESKEIIENDGIFKVSAIDRAKTRVNKFIHVSDTDSNAKLTITPNKTDATNSNITLTLEVKSGVSDVTKITLPDGNVINIDPATNSGTFEATNNGVYKFTINLSDGSTVEQKFTVQNIDKEAPIADVSKTLAPDGSKRYIVNIHGQDAQSAIKSITVDGKTINQASTKILTDSTNPIKYTVTDTFDNSKEYTVDLEQFPTYSEIAEGLLDANMWVPTINTVKSEAVLYLDFSALENVKSIKTPDGKTTTETVFEYTCTKNGEHNFEVIFEDGSVYKKSIEITGLDADNITSTPDNNPGTPGTDTPDTGDGTDKPGTEGDDTNEDPDKESSKDENPGNNGSNNGSGSSSDKSNPQTGDEGIKGYVIGFISLITLAIGGVLLQKKMNKTEEDVNEIDDINDEEIQ